jgi:hypothetical protein
VLLFAGAVEDRVDQLPERLLGVDGFDEGLEPADLGVEVPAQAGDLRGLDQAVTAPEVAVEHGDRHADGGDDVLDPDRDLALGVDHRHRGIDQLLRHR